MKQHQQLQQTAHEPSPFLTGFVPFSALWEGGGDEPPLFPSELAARWFVREHRAELVDREAIARQGRRLYVDRERCKQIARRVAIESARMK